MENLNNSAHSIFRGSFYIIAGILLLFHTLGWLQQGVNTIMIFAALWLITYGFFISGLFHQLARVLQRK